MKLYQIFERLSYNREGSLKVYEQPMIGPVSKTIFTTLEKAKSHLPCNNGSTIVGFVNYFVKEVNID